MKGGKLHVRMKYRFYVCAKKYHHHHHIAQRINIKKNRRDVHKKRCVSLCLLCIGWVPNDKKTNRVLHITFFFTHVCTKIQNILLLFSIQLYFLFNLKLSKKNDNKKSFIFETKLNFFYCFSLVWLKFLMSIYTLKENTLLNV